MYGYQRTKLSLYPHCRCHSFMRRVTLFARPILSMMVFLAPFPLRLEFPRVVSPPSKENSVITSLILLSCCGRLSGGVRRDLAVESPGASLACGVSQKM